MLIRLILLTLFVSCTHVKSPSLDSTNQFFIVEVSPNKYTAMVRQNLEHLIKIYDLNPYLYNKEVKIQSGATPSATPEITINTKYAESPKSILFLFLHFQLLQGPFVNTLNFKNIETALKNDPAFKSIRSKQLLIVSYLNLKVLNQILGTKEMRLLMNEISKTEPHLMSYYSAVIKHYKSISKLVDQHKLRL